MKNDDNSLVVGAYLRHAHWTLVVIYVTEKMLYYYNTTGSAEPAISSDVNTAGFKPVNYLNILLLITGKLLDTSTHYPLKFSVGYLFA